MSSELETAPHFRVKYSSGANENGEKEKSEVKTQHQEVNLPEGDISVTLEKEQLQNKYNKLSNNYSQLQTQLLVMCPIDWAKFGRSCYFKSTERKIWSESRTDCQSRGADLVIINNKEEQEFIELNMRGDSWIGLTASYKRETGKHEWEWVDGSPLTEAFWVPGRQDPDHGFSAVCCEIKGKWTRSQSSVSKTWICEK
ncbi:C-type lectin domain family 4 member M isoform X5 [Oreochromis niloticus]|uniref:C-type lectin domain family 4 member M isoform X5 n=1 Tax=Oreochromis niloticus TaxID=8128 RepID=UPI000DF492D2|nr:C-type lectin domain family 4 member M isoform X5 [Oreochromis niloticus]